MESNLENDQVRLKSPGTKLGLWIGLLILFIPLAVYICDLCPTVFVGDAGDFLTASYTLGVPHPPGYPVYTLLGKLFMELPIPGGISSPAYRMNMLSAVAAWLACVFMFLFLRRILRTEWAAIAGALVLAFSRQFWEHSEIAEVYTLQVFFLTLIFYLAVLLVQEKKAGWALLLAFMMGLAMAHQYAILMFYPGVLIFLGMNGALRLRWHTWVLAIILATIGLAPYAYLPIVKYKTPLGEVVFVETEEEALGVPLDKVVVKEDPLVYFWKYFARLHYSESRKFTHTEEVLPDRTTTPMVFKKYLETTEEDFGYPLLLFGIFGWIALAVSLGKKRGPSGTDGIIIPRAAFLPPVLGYIIYFTVVHFYPSGDILAAPLENINVVIPPLLIPLQVSLAMIIALGFDSALRWIAAYVKSSGVADLATNQKFKTFSALLVIAAFTLIGVNAWTNAEYGDKSGSVISYNYTLNVLDSCDPNAILLTTGDETFLFWYAQECDGYRKDVWATNWIHNLTSLAILADESDAMRIVMERFIASSTYYTPYLELINVNIPEDQPKILPILPYYGNGPINATFIPATFAESGFIMNLDVVLQGLTYAFRLPGDIPDPNLEGIRVRADLTPIESGSAPMRVIDYFDSRPFAEYRMKGLPRFEGLASDLSNLETALYYRINLEAQEMEVLGRYQDAYYRFGIQALLEKTMDSGEDAVNFLFQCVSLDPDDGFGWNELGDAFIATGRLDSAEGAFLQLIELSMHLHDVEPNYEAHAHAQLGQIALIRSTSLKDEEKEAALALAESEARIALLLNPDNALAPQILEIVRERLSVTQDEDVSEHEEGFEESVVSEEDAVVPDSRENLREFDF